MDKFCDHFCHGFDNLILAFGLGYRRNVRNANSLDILSYGIFLLNLAVILFFYLHHLFHSKVFFSKDALSKLTDIVELSLPILVHILTIVCALRYRKRNHRIIAQQKDIDKILKSLNPEAFRKTKTKSVLIFILKSFVIHFIGIGFETFMMISLTPGNLDWRNSWIARLFSNNALRMCDSLYLYYCDYLSSRLSLFNQELSRMSSENLNQNDWQFLNKLKVLKVIDLKIYQLSNDIRDYFKYFLLANISSYIMIIVIDVYWIYASLLFQSNPYDLRKFKKHKILLLFLNSF